MERRVSVDEFGSADVSRLPTDTINTLSVRPLKHSYLIILFKVTYLLTLRNRCDLLLYTAYGM